MRRYYAFEAEGVSEEVKAQLEKVEDVVEDKCETKADCEKILDKIEAEEDKFNGALGNMADAAKDCKDGKCDKAEMTARINPEMAELKEVAKSIGVASEGETVTEAEVKDAKDYLEGAKEIVEAKMDEIEGDDSGKDDGDDAGEDAGDDDDDKGCDDGAEECFFGGAAQEAFVGNYKKAKNLEDTELIKKALAYRSRKTGKTFRGDAEAKGILQAAAKKFNDTVAGENPPHVMNVRKIGGAYVGVYTIGDKLREVHVIVEGASKTTPIGATTLKADAAKDIREDYKVAKKDSRSKVDASLASKSRQPAPESYLDFDEFIDACESYSISTAGRRGSVPYLFD
jgi:hypothetical protein